MPDFPVLDAPRTETPGRTIFDSFGFIEAYLEEIEGWISLPLRLVHDQAEGWHLELGPYSLSHSDIERLREAITGYDQATGKP